MLTAELLAFLVSQSCFAPPPPPPPPRLLLWPQDSLCAGRQVRRELLSLDRACREELVSRARECREFVSRVRECRELLSLARACREELVSLRELASLAREWRELVSLARECRELFSLVSLSLTVTFSLSSHSLGFCHWLTSVWLKEEEVLFHGRPKIQSMMGALVRDLN